MTELPKRIWVYAYDGAEGITGGWRNYDAGDIQDEEYVPASELEEAKRENAELLEELEEARKLAGAFSALHEKGEHQSNEVFAENNRLRSALRGTVRVRTLIQQVNRIIDHNWAGATVRDAKRLLDILEYLASRASKGEKE